MATKNVDAFLTVVQCTTTNYTTTEEEASETSKNSDESVSSLILDVVKSLQGDKGAIVEQILKVYYKILLRILKLKLRTRRVWLNVALA